MVEKEFEKELDFELKRKAQLNEDDRLIESIDLE